ncbi:MAG: class I SAM-dependent methyltransferase [Candidatus Omnitrophica bacterium]|nr:class I SAM-dependent methyltransferase [Candidatus Omnitrophota bacterium]
MSNQKIIPTINSQQSMENFIRDDSPLREIVKSITTEQLQDLGASLKILEVGCGNRTFIKQLVEQRQSQWFGLDLKKNSAATHKGSVSKIPFPDGFFDRVIASQSIEHWYEYATTFNEGLHEIYRVLKRDGEFILNYPLYLHGHPFFMLGKTDRIHALFSPEVWKIEDIRIHHPAQPFYCWQGRRLRLYDQWFMTRLVKRQHKSAYIEQIVLCKNKQDIPRRSSMSHILRGIEKLGYTVLYLMRGVTEKVALYIIRTKGNI